MVKFKVKVGANLIELDFDACTMDKALVRRQLRGDAAAGAAP